MRKIIISILLLLVSSTSFADIFKFNPYTGKLDNLGPFTFSLFPDCNGTGKALSFTAATNTFTCNTITASSAAGGNAFEWQYNNTGSADGVPRTYASSAGNVGIGTTVVPNGLLEITKNSATDYFNASTIGNHGDIFNIKNSGNVGIGTTTPQDRLIVIGGNVGIGTLGPTSLLSVGTGGNVFNIDSSGNLTTVNGTAVTWNATQLSLNTNGIALFQNTNNGASALTKIKGGANAASSLQLMPTSGAGVGSEFISLAVGNNGGSEVMRITGAGNVGIGTTVAPNKEYVAGTLETQGFKLPGNGVAAGSVLMSNSVGVGTWMPASAVAINSVGANPSASVGLSAVNGSATTFMRSDAAPQLDQAIVPTWTGLHAFNKSPISLTTTNNVGIGTSTPPNILYVAGTSEMQGFQLRGNGVAAGSILQTNSVGIGTWMKVTDVVGSTGGASFYQTVQDEGSDLTQRSKVNFVGNGVTCADNGGTSVTDCTINGGAGSSQWVTSTNVGIGTYDNVGIGTTKPLAKLVVLSGNVGIGTWTSDSFELTIKGSQANVLLDSLNTGSLPYVQFNSNGTQSALFGLDGAIEGNTNSNLGFFGVGGKTIKFYPGGGGTAKEIFDTNGNIGINQASASAKLDINTGASNRVMINQVTDSTTYNTISLNGAITAATTTGLFAGDATDKNLYIQQGDTSSGIVFYNHGGEKDRFDSNGNLGIGTSIIPNKAYFAGTVEMQGFKLPGNGVATGRILQTNSVGVGTWMNPGDVISSSGGGSPPGGTGSELQFRGGASTFSAVSGSSVDGNGNIGLGTTVAQNTLIVLTGNVGIGTVSPETMLKVQGTGTFGTTNNLASSFPNTVGIGTNSPSVSASILIVNGGVGIGTANGAYATLAAPAGGLIVGGNVGIGTFLPNSPLTIFGGTILKRLTGANTACSTTCGSNACYFGEDTGVLGT